MRRAALTLVLATLPLAAACDPPPEVMMRNAPKDPQPRTQPAPAPSPAPAAGMAMGNPIAVADFQKLRWIEGSWRGAGSGQAPFFERYRFADDSTLVVDSFADSTLANVRESSRVELRGGKLTNGGPTARWRASRLDDRSVLFVPEVGVRNAFMWRYESPDVWMALLEWPASETRPAARAEYRMERIRPR